MKHDLTITLVLLVMFLATQIIGLVVIDTYNLRNIQVTEQTPEGLVLVNKTIGIIVPYGMETPEMAPEVSIVSILVAVLFATLIFLLLTRLRAAFIIKAWFFFVITITSSISLTALLSLAHPSWDRVLTMDFGYPLTLISVIAVVISLVLAFYKIVKRNFLIHNISELLIYPGLAAMFVPMLNIKYTIVLLLLISVYDMYAVWKSKHMVKLAQYQIQDLKIFTGFFLPYVSSRSFNDMQKLKQAKNVSMAEVKKKTSKIKVSLAILGGGDVAFPLIFAGVVMRASTFLNASIIAIAATLSLLLLFILAKKEKFYPAMPFITAGCILGYLVTLLI